MIVNVTASEKSRETPRMNFSEPRCGEREKIHDRQKD